MRKEERGRVAGIHAPGPRATPWAAALVATALCLLFIVGLGIWRLASALVG